MYSVFLWISLISLIYKKWGSPNIFQTYNDTTLTLKENIINSMNRHSQFFIIPDELEPQEVVHLFTIWNI